MFVRQYIFSGAILLLLLSSKTGFAQNDLSTDDDEIFTDIEQITEEMEEYVTRGEMENLFKLYKNNSYLLIPDKTYQGHKEVKKYWSSIKNIKSWELEILETSQNEEEVYENQYYQSLTSKPAGWRQRGIELDEEHPLIYELAYSILTVEDDKGNQKKIEADTIFVWQVQPNGTYRIVLNTYSWQ